MTPEPRAREAEEAWRKHLDANHYGGGPSSNPTEFLAGWAAAIETAAKVCDQREDMWSRIQSSGASSRHNEGAHLAELIRALSPEKTT